MTQDERSDARSRLRGQPHRVDDAAADLALVSAVAEQGSDDVDDLLAALSLLRHIRDEIVDWEPRLITAARAAGVSWARLAPALGVASRQAAERRYLRLRPDGTDNSAEQRVRAERDRRAGDRAVLRWARENATLLRQLAAAVSAADGLAADAQRSVDDVTTALGDDDSASLLTPLAGAGPMLRDTHPDLANRIAEVGVQTERTRDRPAG
ncbi:HSP18 transcriptional regulator [Actinokineospora inagensis]|uniref:HSP18 transcriptional regulator n=1 Tax=Actinokineospora inagensis TaxID=103730 RepID=UPI0004022C6F|nr:HSP18 transcriptional regulator [Actinokineospora inagensis]